MPNKHTKMKCHICGAVQRKDHLITQHYPLQHKNKPIEPLFVDDNATKLLEPNFKGTKPGPKKQIQKIKSC